MLQEGMQTFPSDRANHVERSVKIASMLEVCTLHHHSQIKRHDRAIHCIGPSSPIHGCRAGTREISSLLL